MLVQLKGPPTVSFGSKAALRLEVPMGQRTRRIWLWELGCKELFFDRVFASYPQQKFQIKLQYINSIWRIFGSISDVTILKQK
jgi:hypothetical protein